MTLRHNENDHRDHLGVARVRRWATRVSALSLLLLASCAKQGYPSGGPKDVTPPQALGAKPANESRHFAAREFYIQFDEYVVLKNADDNVLVSPPMQQKPEYTTKGKGVLVRLKDTLQPNTTYLFQFKEAIADFTEGNALPSYEYVFSTGEAMDTLMLAGSVVASRDGKAWKESVTVMAYRVESGETPQSFGQLPSGRGATMKSDTIGQLPSGRGETPQSFGQLPSERGAVMKSDTMATTVQPDYVTRTDKEGRFAFHYIPAGRYRLVALEDKNKNLRVDSTEAVAWDTTLTAAADSIDSTRLSNLYISAPDRSRQRVLKAEFKAPGRIVVSAQLPMQHPRLEGERLEWRQNAKGDTLDIWCLNEQCDSTVLVLTTDEGLRDTLKLRYRKPAAKGRRGNLAQPKTPLIRTLCDGSKAYYDSLLLAFSAPVHAVGEAPMAEVMHLKDSTVGRCAIRLDSSGLTARLDTVLHSGEEYQIRLADSLFADLYGHPSDSLRFRATPRDYGILTLRVDNRTGHPLVVEVLDKRDTVVLQRPLAGSGTLRLTHLPAGDYRLRAVVDRDGNGRWTPGDYLLGRQPEEHHLFEKTLSLREKWEMEEPWSVGAPLRKRAPLEADGPRGLLRQP